MKRLLEIIGITLSVLILFSACGSDHHGTSRDGQTKSLPVVTTSAISSITTMTATGGGNVASSGGANVTERGICWGTSSSPVIAGSHTASGTGTGSFTGSITGLNPNTLYYVRAYATNSVGTAYGNQVTFTTSTQGTNQSLPDVTTATISSITSTIATGGGNVTSDGGASVTERGICWGTTSSPVITGAHVASGTGTGAFTGSMTGLNPNTLYYVRAYATNSVGTAYGSEVTFTTAALTYTLGITISPEGSGTVTTDPASGPFDEDEIVTLTPAPSAGYQFKEWSGADGADVSSNQITMDADKEITAVFEAVTGVGWKDFSPGLAGLGGLASLSGMSWISDDEGWISSSMTVNGGGEIYYTTDGGKTFVTQTTRDYTNAIHMLNADEGYAGGKDGYVYHTTDGGDTWTSIGSIGNTLMDIAFPPSSTTGYAAGYSGKIYRITSSGLESMSTGVASNLASISFPGSEGWVCGENVIERYTGYGSVWTGDQAYPTYFFNAIYMVSDTTGWAVGDSGVIIHTTDGANWEEQASPTSNTLLDVFFLDANEGWAVGNAGTIVHTTDGGATWNIEAAGMTTSMLRRVQFTSSTNGYVLGNNGVLFRFTDQEAPDPVAPTVQTGTVSGITSTTAGIGGYVTSSGASNVTAKGVCWSTSENPTLSNSHTDNGTGTGSYFPSMTGLAPDTTYHVRAYAVNAVGTSYGSDVSFTTTASSAQWKDFSPGLAGLGGLASLSGMSWISDDEGWISSSVIGEIYHTTDGGKTFTTQTTTYSNNTIYMLDADEGYAGGYNGYVYHTTNGGDTWTSIGSIGNTLMDIAFPPSSTTGYASGYSGKIYRITSSGLTSMSSGVYSNLASISFPGSEGWVCGESMIERYTGSGSVWTEDQTYPPSSFNAIYMVSATTGWAVGDSGVIIHTTDGINWELQTSPTSNTLLDVFFLDANEGWAVGNAGTIVHTTDGGATWNIEAPGMTTRMLRRVQFISSTNGYILGNNGVLLKFTEE